MLSALFSPAAQSRESLTYRHQQIFTAMFALDRFECGFPFRDRKRAAHQWSGFHLARFEQLNGSMPCSVLVRETRQHIQFLDDALVDIDLDPTTEEADQHQLSALPDRANALVQR